MATTHNSNVARVIGFFVKNPDEELTSTDIVIKFDIARSNVHVTLRRAVEAGLLTRRSFGVGRDCPPSIYSAGDALLEIHGEWRLLEERRAKSAKGEAAIMACFSLQMCSPVP